DERPVVIADVGGRRDKIERSEIEETARRHRERCRALARAESPKRYGKRDHAEQIVEPGLAERRRARLPDVVGQPPSELRWAVRDPQSVLVDISVGRHERTPLRYPGQRAEHRGTMLEIRVRLLANG